MKCLNFLKIQNYKYYLSYHKTLRTIIPNKFIKSRQRAFYITGAQCQDLFEVHLCLFVAVPLKSNCDFIFQLRTLNVIHSLRSIYLILGLLVQLKALEDPIINYPTYSINRHSYCILLLLDLAYCDIQYRKYKNAITDCGYKNCIVLFFLFSLLTIMVICIIYSIFNYCFIFIHMSPMSF